MSPLKAPDPDGFPISFYQEHWASMGLKVCRVVSNFFSSGIMDENVNSTFITLIPKKSTPSRVSEFRPISLCNVMYKIIAKVLANRLKEVLPHIISSNQSAFILGRLISDNVLAAYETLHSMHTRMWSKVGLLL